jgi:hypothetical protein
MFFRECWHVFVKMWDFTWICQLILFKDKNNIIAVMYLRHFLRGQCSRVEAKARPRQQRLWPRWGKTEAEASKPRQGRLLHEAVEAVVTTTDFQGHTNNRAHWHMKILLIKNKQQFSIKAASGQCLSPFKVLSRYDRGRNLEAEPRQGQKHRGRAETEADRSRPRQDRGTRLLRPRRV